MPAKDSGIRFQVLYALGKGRKARFNHEGDAREFAADQSKRGHEATLWNIKEGFFMDKYIEGRRQPRPEET